jgi:RNA recognition motif-containing protein
MYANMLDDDFNNEEGTTIGTSSTSLDSIAEKNGNASNKFQKPLEEALVCHREIESTSMNNAIHEGTDLVVGNDLFIGDLARDVTEHDLQVAFQPFGNIKELIIKRAKMTKVSLCYGFVKYSTHESAQTALSTMHGSQINGKDIRVSWAQRNARIHVSNLDSSVTTLELIAEFKKFGQLHEDDTQVHKLGERELREVVTFIHM